MCLIHNLICYLSGCCTQCTVATELNTSGLTSSLSVFISSSPSPLPGDSCLSGFISCMRKKSHFIEFMLFTALCQMLNFKKTRKSSAFMLLQGTLQITVFWDVMPRCWVIGSQRFEGSFCLHRQGSKVQQEFFLYCLTLTGRHNNP